MKRSKLIGGIAACAVMGPLTGPLALGLVSCVRAKRPWMASVYALGIVEVIVGLPLLLKLELDWLASLN
jgi:hypothetical protein